MLFFCQFRNNQEKIIIFRTKNQKYNKKTLILINSGKNQEYCEKINT